MPTNLKNKVTDSAKLELEGLEKEVSKLKKEIAELKKRGDHEIIIDGVSYFINFNEMLRYFDAAASGGIRQNQFVGAQGSHYALAKILGLLENEKDSEEYHAGKEKARTLLLKYRGAN